MSLIYGDGGIDNSGRVYGDVGEHAVRRNDLISDLESIVDDLIMECVDCYPQLSYWLSINIRDILLDFISVYVDTFEDAD